MIPVIVIRPEPGCAATLAEARARGLEAVGHPLFAVRPVAWVPPDPAGIDALLIGSANALRHAGDALNLYRGKPAYAVGRTSADAAKAVGLAVVAAGEGGLQALLGQLRPKHQQLLRLAGAVRTELALPAGREMTERIVYSSERQPITPALAALMEAPAVVLLHSAEAARHFAACCDDSGIPRAHLSLAVIGPRVAEAAGKGWKLVAAAARADDSALLDLAYDMCQKRG